MASPTETLSITQATDRLVLRLADLILAIEAAGLATGPSVVAVELAVEEDLDLAA